MPFECRPVRLLCPNGRNANYPPIKVVIDEAVVELITDSRANAESEIRVNRDVALIEQAVNVAAKEDAIGHLVRSVLAVRADVGRLKRW